MAFPRLYKLESSSAYGLAMPVEPVLVPGKMAVTVTISTQAEDRSGDVVVTEGIDCSKHKDSPVVFYDHALAHVKFPVGKSEDPDRNYTIRKEPGRLIATTYFSQAIPEGEQVYRLIEEGILRGASIGFKPLKGRYLPTEIDPHNPFPTSGMLLERTELLEYSHTPIPDNPECLVEALGKSYLTSEMLRKSFAASAPARKPQITVPELPPMSQAAASTEKPADQSKVNKGADPSEYVPLDGTADGADEGMTRDMLPGACALKGIYDRAMELSSFMADQYGRQENEHVNSLMDELSKALDEHTGNVSGKYKELYPDYDPLSDEPATKSDAPGEDGAEQPAEDANPDEDAFDDSLADDGEDDYAVKSAKRWAKRQTANGRLWKRVCAVRKRRQEASKKRLSKSAVALCGQAASLLAEVSALKDAAPTESQRIAAEHLGTQLSSVTAEPAGTDTVASVEFKALQKKATDLSATVQKLHRQLKAALNGR